MVQRSAAPMTRRLDFAIHGMSCASCVGAVERALAAVPGVQQVAVNLAAERGSVRYDPSLADPAADHERVMRAAAAAVRKIDPERLIILDGVSWGTEPCPELANLGTAQSCRAYAPMGVSHYMATWVGGENWPEPAWPGRQPDGLYWDRTRLEEFYRPWIELASGGSGVHCGEGGAFSHTPHPVVLAWYRDVLEILTPENIGFALWNLRGGFGILDSERQDVAYEDWYGHRLDRRLLELYADPAGWAHKAILNVAGMGRFSSDRAIQEYAERVWHTRPVSR